MFKRSFVSLVVALCVLSGCGSLLPPVMDPHTVKKDPAALKGDYSGKDASGSYAIIRVPGNIPHVPASNGKAARWSQVEVDQVLYLDADCQSQLYDQLPGWAQAIAKESGWAGLATAVGEGAFASAFPGVKIVRYILGGLGFGLAVGANTGRIRQESNESNLMGNCVAANMRETNKRYGILEGLNGIPWSGNGKVTLPKAKDASNAPTLPRARGDNGTAIAPPR